MKANSRGRKAAKYRSEERQREGKRIVVVQESNAPDCIKL